ncbi:MAG: SPFH domain-containing protein [Ardenticatenaceae bacterium]|nr:SPFH domain-containing protein [Ardenticatenaceae bacterium]
MSSLTRLLLIAGGFSLVVYFLQDYLGVQFGFFGVIVWLSFLAIIFLGGIAYHALFIVPAGVENWYTEGMQLIWQYFLSNTPKKEAVERDGVPPSIETLGAGVVESHIALALGKGSGFSRAVGPGYIKLDPGEYIRHVIDLRPHTRRQRLKAMTHDGIPLEAMATVVFRVRRLPEGEASANEPFPYDKKAVFQVSYFCSVAEGGGEIFWTDRVGPLAAAAFTAELSNYTLDTLYPFDEGQQPNPGSHTRIERLTHHVKQRLAQQLAENGIELVDLQLTDIELPADITHQRIEHLQTEWQRASQIAQADGDVELLRELEDARTTAEVELIRQIVDTIERLKVSDRSELGDVITLVTIEALEKAALEEQLSVHPQILQTLSQVQSMLAFPAEQNDRPQLPPHSQDTELYDSDVDEWGIGE